MSIKYKIGDIIELDCGYGPQENVLKCVILDIQPSFNVFKEPRWDIYVVDPDGEKFYTELPRNPAEYLQYKKDLTGFINYIFKVINPIRIKADLAPMNEEEAIECFEILRRVHNE